MPRSLPILTHEFSRPGGGGVSSPTIAAGLVGLLALSVLDRFGRLAVVGGAQITIYQVAIAFAFGWAAWLVVVRRVRVRRLVFSPWIALLLLGAGLAIPSALSVKTAVVQFLSLVSSVGLGILVGWLCGTPGRMRAVLSGVLALCGVLAVLALLESAGIFAVQPQAVLWESAIRARVTLNDPNILGGLLAAAVAAAVPLALGSAVRVRAGVLWAVAVLCAGGAVATQSRGALLGLLIAAVLGAALSPVPRRVKLRFAAVALVAAGIGLAILGPAWVALRVVGVASDPSATDRFGLIVKGLRLFPARPLGVGPGNWRLAIEAAFGPVASGPIESHMTLVTVLVEDGLLGLLGIVGAGASAIIGALRTRRSGIAPETLAAVCATVVLLIQSTTYSMETSKPLWFFLGLCAASIAAERVRRRAAAETRPKVCMIQYNASRYLARVDRAARAIAGAGAEVVLIAIQEPGTEAFEQRSGYVVKRVDVVSRRWPSWARPIRWVEAVARTWVAALREQADAYDARDIYPLLVAWRAARANDARFIYDSDELNLYRNWPWTSTRWWQVLAKAYEGFFVRRADSVITSDPGRAVILRGLYGVDALVVRNVANILEQVEPDHAFRAMALKGQERLLLYTGGIVANRGLEALVDSLELLPGYALAIMGSGHLEAAIRTRIEERGLEGRAEVYSAVPLDELMRRTASADAAVMPILGTCLSYVHAVPQKLYEAMMVGIPSVASDLPDMAEVVRSEGVGTLIADPSIPASIADAVRCLFDLGEDELGAMRARARAAALNRLNWTIEQESLVGEYRRLGLLGPEAVAE